MRPPRKPWATGASIKVQVDLPCKVFRTKNMLKPEVLNFFTCCPKKINKSRAFLSTRTYMYIYYIICTSWKRPIPNNKDKGQIDLMRRRPCTGGRVNNCYWTASLCTALMLKSLAPFMSRNNSDRFRDVERSMNFTWIRRYFTKSFPISPLLNSLTRSLVKVHLLHRKPYSAPLPSKGTDYFNVLLFGGWHRSAKMTLEFSRSKSMCG